MSASLRALLLLCGLFGCVTSVVAQDEPVPGEPVTLDQEAASDTAAETNTSQWRDERAYVFYQRLDERTRLFPDSSIHRLHRRPFSEPWLRDLGNLGSAIYNMYFTPEFRAGPTLGYHAFDPYRLTADSLPYYHTTRPYSIFSFGIGSRAEQCANIFHTQNIQPRWNIAVQYRRLTSPGYYKIQRTAHDDASLTTNYAGKKQHYRLQAALTYNKIQLDENGGQAADTFLENAQFADRKTIPVRFQNDAYSVTRSSVSNVQRDFTVLLHHSYAFGRMDTLYNQDSTQYAFKLNPRFRIGHQLRIHSEKHTYKDLAPDSNRYAELFQRRFFSGDSVYQTQTWQALDNGLFIEGLVGPAQQQLQILAGFGARTDRFATANGLSKTEEAFFSNYLFASVRKDAQRPDAWTYQGQGLFYVTGSIAGCFQASSQIGKYFNDSRGFVQIGFAQALNAAPYNYNIYKNAYYERLVSFRKEAISQVYASASWQRTGASAGIRNYLISNYIFVDRSLQFEQYGNTFTVLQGWLNKVFRFSAFVFDNELAGQQKTGNAPVNVPTIMGRHQLSYERYLFKRALKIATGVDVRWHSAYHPPGYSPFFNRFFFQDRQMIANAPEVAIFFSFKVKSFRAYMMGDQLQQIVTRNNINFSGYSGQNAMIRFGFNWVMIN